MQPPSTSDLRARKGRLIVSYPQIAAVLADLGYGYPAGRVRKVLTDHEVSAPLCAAVDEALDVIVARRRAVRDERERELATK